VIPVLLDALAVDVELAISEKRSVRPSARARQLMRRRRTSECSGTVAGVSLKPPVFWRANNTWRASTEVGIIKRFSINPKSSCYQSRSLRLDRRLTHRLFDLPFNGCQDRDANDALNATRRRDSKCETWLAFSGGRWWPLDRTF